MRSRSIFFIFSRAYRNIHHAIFHASREGRCAEIAFWSNTAACFLLGAGTFYVTQSWVVGVAIAAAMFILLRIAIANRFTVWIAASFGTLAVSALGGALAWLFAHVIESSATAPSIAAVAGAVVSATVPAWAFGRLAQRRQEAIPDSLVEPISVPSSRS